MLSSVLSLPDMPGSEIQIGSLKHGPSGNLHSSLEQWKLARTLLSAAIRTYLAACVSLRTACRISTQRNSENAIAKDVMAAIDSELDSLASEEAILCKTRASLVAIRNNSPALAQINVLPPEILGIIFSLSQTYCVHGAQKSNHYNFASVCTSWRSIAMSLPGLWSHIDVGPNTSSALATLLLERSGSYPIYLHVHEPKPPDDVPTAEQKVAQVLGVIKYHGNRIATLDVETESYSRSLVGPVINHWLEMGGGSRTKTLLVYRPKAGMMLTPEGHGAHVTLSSRSENAKAVLGHLTKLHLQNTRFDWDSTAYHNLVDLQLSCFCSRTAISMPELANILSRNPRLAILKLSSIEITSPDDWVPAPIRMNALRVLNLFHIESDGLRLLLRSIGLPASRVEIGIGPTLFGQVYSELEAFLAHSRLHSFYCWQDQQEPLPGWGSMLRLTPHLRNLVMDELRMEDRPFAEKNVGDTQLLLWPRLDRIIFLDSTVTCDGLKELVGACSVRKLQLERCSSFFGGAEGMERIGTALMEAYPELEFTVSDIPTTSQLDYCKIFDR